MSSGFGIAVDEARPRAVASKPWQGQKERAGSAVTPQLGSGFYGVRLSSFSASRKSLSDLKWPWQGKASLIRSTQWLQPFVPVEVLAEKTFDVQVVCALLLCSI